MRLLPFCIGLLLLLPTGGCNIVGQEEAEKLRQDEIDVLNELATTLGGITDEKSSKAANAKLKEIAAKIQQVAERNKNTKVTKSTLNAVNEKFKDKELEAAGKVVKEIFRLSAVPGTDEEIGIVQEALAKVNEKQ
jgi:hypothetical protein